MVRTYVKKPGSRPYASFTSANMELAVTKVRSGEMSIRRACVYYFVPRSTLHNRVKGVHRLKPGHQTVFNDTEEKSLVHHIQVVSLWGFPFTTLDMRMVAKSVLDSAGKNIKCFKNNVPSAEWARSFLKRHEHELTQRSCQNIKRVRANVSPEHINQYFDNLEKSLKNPDGSEIPPHCIFNYDETNLTDDPGLKRCVFKHGVKYPERIKDSSKSSTSVMFCGSATGQVLPPYVVYKSEHLWDLWTRGGVKGTRYNRSKSGWFDAVTFRDWFEKLFVPHVRRLDTRTVLIGDNLASHFCDGVIRAAEANNIAFICLPKNSTHLCQPLDVAFYRPLKMKWRQILDDWKQGNVTKTCVTKDHFPGLLRKLCVSVCGDNENDLCSKNLVAGFRKCGIVPLNRNEVLARLPPSDAADQSLHPPETVDGGAATAVSSAVLSHLSKLRYGDGEQRQHRKRMRLDVEAGSSISFEELHDNAESVPVPVVPSTGTSRPTPGFRTKTKNHTGGKRKQTQEEHTAVVMASINSGNDGDLPEADGSIGPDVVSKPLVADNDPAPRVPTAVSMPVQSFYRNKKKRPATGGVQKKSVAGTSRKHDACVPARYRD